MTIDVKPELQAELAQQAAACGQSVESYAATLLAEAVQRHPANGLKADKQRAQAAADRIRELRRGVTLGGLTIRELIDEGRP